MFNWVNFLVYALVTSVTPGPNNIMSMTNGKTLGLKKSLPFCFGVFIGVFSQLLLCAWLANLIHSFLPLISTPMKIIGSVYMLYLAYKTFTSCADIKENHRKTSILIGALLQFINPKTYLYSIVSMEIYVLPYYQEDPFSISVFALLLSLFALACTILWSIFGKTFSLLFSKYAKITNSFMAILLLYCSISLFL